MGDRRLGSCALDVAVGLVEGLHLLLQGRFGEGEGFVLLGAIPPLVDWVEGVDGVVPSGADELAVVVDVLDLESGDCVDGLE